MDYAGEEATELAAFQWNVIAKPAPFTALDKNKDRMKVSKMHKDNSIKAAGIDAIIRYIIQNKKTEFIKLSSFLRQRKGAYNYTSLITSVLEGKVIVQLENEAKAITEIVSEVLATEKILLKQEEIYNILEPILRDEISTEKRLSIMSLLELSYGISTESIEKYIVAITDSRIYLLTQELEKGHSNIFRWLSNTEYKRLLRKFLGIEEGKVMQHILAKRKSGLSALSRRQEKRLVLGILGDRSAVSRLSKLIPIQEYEKRLSSIVYTKEIGTTSMTIWKFIGKAFLLGSISKVINDIANNEVNPLEAVLMGSIIAPLSLWASLVVDNYSDRFEELYFREFLRWDDILNWQNNKYSSAPLFLQYVEAKDKYSDTVPTTIIFRDISFAEKVFGFRPKYVNYNFINNDRKYVPNFYTELPQNR